MNIKEINEEYRLLEDLSVQDITNIMKDTTFEDVEEYDDEKVVKITLETKYNKYPLYRLFNYNTWIMKEEDYLQYIKDLASMFANCLPDKFERLFNEGGLAEAILDDFSYSWQTIDFLNKFGYDLDKYKIIGSNDQYVALEEIYERYED